MDKSLQNLDFWVSKFWSGFCSSGYDWCHSGSGVFFAVTLNYEKIALLCNERKIPKYTPHTFQNLLVGFFVMPYFSSFLLLATSLLNRWSHQPKLGPTLFVCENLIRYQRMNETGCPSPSIPAPELSMTVCRVKGSLAESSETGLPRLLSLLWYGLRSGENWPKQRF